MLVALLSDVHGNAVALKAVLSELEALGPHRVVFLGDAAGFGPQPRECVRLLTEVGAAAVVGNADAWLLAPDRPEDPTEEQRLSDEIDWWCRAQLGPEDFAALGAYESNVELGLAEDVRLLCCHGSPRSYDDAILSDTPAADLDAMLGGVEAEIVAAGHTHVPLLRRHGERTIVNPGSVGLPYVLTPEGRARNPVWAEYALLSYRDGRLDVSLRRVPFDIEELRRATLASGMPHAAAWLADWC